MTYATHICLAWTLLSSVAQAVPALSSTRLVRPQQTPKTQKPSTNCEDGTWDLTGNNYRRFETDLNFRTWWTGGQNAGGPIYPAQRKGKDSFLTIALAEHFFPTGSEDSFVCTLESGKCDLPDGCKNYRLQNETTDQVGDPIHWAWFATHSISNLASFAQAFQEAFQNAGIQVNFDLLDLTKTFTKKEKDQQILTKDLLIGFSFLVTAAFSVVPVVGPLLSAGAGATAAGAVGAAGAVAGGALSTTNGILSNSLASGAGLDAKAADFGAFMSQVWNITGDAIYSLIRGLMNGEAMDGPAPLLLGVLNGGEWVESEALFKSDSLSIPSLQRAIYKDLLQRGINHIWSQSKIWVSFADLKDGPDKQKCRDDRKGWQASKTCADGGVYYLYRFNEDGHLNGQLDYPWGADKMTDEPYGLNPSWVTHSSALAYRSQNGGKGGFAFDYTKAPTNLPNLLTSIADTRSLSNLQRTRWRLEHLRVRHGHSLGLEQRLHSGRRPFHTAAFVAGAQMNNFDTVVKFCKVQLAPCAAWPSGATEVDFGSSGKIEKKEPSGEHVRVLSQDRSC